MKKCIVLMMVAVCLCGCRMVKTVTVERVTHDTLWHQRTLRDSVFVHDSIFSFQTISGDTVRIITDRWHTQWRERLCHDTVSVVKVDSIPQPYEVVKEVNVLTWWQRARLALVNALLAGCVGCGVIWVIRKKIL